MAAQVVLVTGASTGIGRAIAARLAGAGHRVFGTSRRPAGVSPLPGVTFLPLDVTDEASVAACLEAVRAAAGRLDVVVNNAGIVVAGAVEEVNLAEFQRQLDTNLHGVLRVTRAALPLMRAQGAGLIVGVGSVAGMIAMPFAGAYTASKFALEGLYEALRAEVKALGIRVALVEPGFFKSELVGGMTVAAQSLEAYGAARERVLARVRRLEAAAPPPAAVADRVLALVEDPAPPLRNVVGREWVYVLLKRLLPQAWYEPSGRKHWRLDD